MGDDWSDQMAHQTWGCLASIIRGTLGLIFTGLFAGGVYMITRRRQKSYDLTNSEQWGLPQRPQKSIKISGRLSLLSWFGYLGLLSSGIGLSLLLDALNIFSTSDPNQPISNSPKTIQLIVSIGFSMVGASMIGVVVIMGGLDLIRRKKSKVSKQTHKTSVPPPLIYQPMVYSIRLPENIRPNMAQAYQLMEQLTLANSPLILQIEADSRGVAWRIVDFHQMVPGVIPQVVRGVYPEAEVSSQVYQHQVQDEWFLRYLSFYRQANHFVAPIRYVNDLHQADPLASLAQALSDLQPYERVIYNLILLGDASDAYASGYRMITQSTIHPLQLLSSYGRADALGKVVTGQNRTEKFRPQDQRVLEDKLNQPLLRAMLVIQVDAPHPDRLLALLILADNPTANFARIPYNALQYVQERSIPQYAHEITSPELDQRTSVLGMYYQIAMRMIPEVYHPPRLILDIREAAALWHLPHERFKGRVQRLSGNDVAISYELARHKPARSIELGWARYQGKSQTITLAEQDRRLHINIIGKTGMGKSNLLHQLIHQDIQAGNGVAVIDPHGTLIEAILQSSIPFEREEDVVLLDLNDQEHPPPINPMRSHQGTVGTGRVLNILERLFDGTEQYVRIAKYLRAALELLVSDPEATMRDISRVFRDDEYRNQLLSQTSNPFVEDVWLDFAENSAAQQRQIHEPILSRITPFYSNPVLYPILCHPQVIDFGKLMKQRKIILISLAMPEDLVAERERNLIGALVVSMLQMAGMQDMHTTDQPFYVYIDEVQKFVTTSLDIVLSEARKFGLSLTIANQFLGQLTGKTLEAVVGNVGTTIVFRCSPDDAKALGIHMRPQFDASALVNLAQFTAATKMQIGGRTEPAFTLAPAKPILVPDHGKTRETFLRDLSRTHYVPQSRQDILEWLKDRYPRRHKLSHDTEELVQDYD